MPVVKVVRIGTAATMHAEVSWSGWAAATGRERRGWGDGRVRETIRLVGLKGVSPVTAQLSFIKLSIF